MINRYSKTRNRKKSELKVAARRLHAVWWFEESTDKEKMIAEWNDLYPSAQITIEDLRKEYEA